MGSGTTTSSDVTIATEILEPAIAGAFAGMRAIMGTGAAVINPTMPSSVQRGKKITIPYFGTIGEFVKVSGEDDAIAPSKLTSTHEETTVERASLGFERTVFERLVEDPRSDAYTEASRQIAVAGERLVDNELITKAVASLPAMTNDVYNAATPKTISPDVILDTQKLWGDEQDNMAALVVHSKVYFDLKKLKDGEGRALLTSGFADGLDRFGNIPIVVSDRMTASSDSPAKYKTLLLKRNSLVFWYCAQPRTLNFVDPAADTEGTFVHVYFASYRYQRLPMMTKPGVAILVTN